MFLVLTIIAILSIFYLLNSKYSYWVNRGVPGPKPLFFFGNLLDNYLLKKSLAEVYSDIYKQYPDAPLVGIFKSFSPCLVIRDSDLIKNITIKSFQHFHDNEILLDKNVDPISGRNPFFLSGEEWKKTRVHLTPGFTSGKMKLIYPLLEELSRNFVKYIEKQVTSGEGVKIKEECMRFTLNNVGSTAFGLDAKCFEEDNPEFKQIADRFLTPEGFQNVKMFLITIAPFLSKLVSIRFTPNDVEKRLINIVKETLDYREKNNITRNDVLNVLSEIARKEKDFDLIDIVAHAAGFFGDGYETSSVVMHFILYELASNPEAQSKLRQEVKKAFDENNGSISYEQLQNLSYLDAVFNESQRLHPALGSLNKACTKPYTYEPKENDVIKKSFVIEAGTTVILPLYGLHRDPKYFDEPDSFKPERFLDENKINFKDAFMPFGQGPKACLGQRYGSMQVKIGIAYLIQNFEISVNKKTKLPIHYDPLYFLTLPKHPIWLDFKKIQ